MPEFDIAYVPMTEKQMPIWLEGLGSLFVLLAGADQRVDLPVELGMPGAVETQSWLARAERAEQVSNLK